MFAILNDMDALGPRISHALRRERDRAGLSVSELARRAGVGKATVSQLESGTANPSVETLWAIATALDVPFAVFVAEPDEAPTLIRARDGSGIRASDAPYEALLLAAGAPQSRSDLYLLRAEPGSPRSSQPHSPRHHGARRHRHGLRARRSDGRTGRARPRRLSALPRRCSARVRGPPPRHHRRPRLRGALTPAASRYPPAEPPRSGRTAG
ncbi:helix-turn-helix domain-containing protein [Microbacterium hominis]|uniref:helix-turn-helix domain-containing protein n=1 Tax=Microbacterium hominis TaxID=162426 RepID=UPI00295F468B|nr:helix-turn-helix transcriptional regulator [Microbacterium hominis]